jgi:hypothetical protein
MCFTVDGRLGAGKFSVPDQGALAPAGVGIKVAAIGLVAGFLEPGKGLGPPVVERRPGLLPRRCGYATGPVGAIQHKIAASRGRNPSPASGPPATATAGPPHAPPPTRAHDGNAASMASTPPTAAQ